ncbi:MAG: DNA polymerase III subunit gamma/tau [Clostridiales bacterium]|nr:DNA polymerase III subunit gamma/tau [Clostridiales bacterium]
MYKALYRQYRPEVFEEVLGQDHIVRILKNQIATDSTSHAYLFCGTRGTGKTTTARLLAKGLNCLSDGERPCGVCANCQAIKEGNFLDVIEIDAASNNGVDNVRELRESVKYPPSAGRRKVYIIDEVHMLSTEAFNALLKTLEEPPEYVTFILATTEVHKLPATVLSRCMRLDFKRVPESVLMEGMADICAKIGIDVTEDALRIIAANADGSVRDGLSILDQCISGRDMKVDADEVLEFLGASGYEDFIELTDMVRKKRTEEAIAFLNGILSDGKDVRQFMRDWISHYRNLMMVKFMRNPETVVSMSAENIERMRRQAAVLELEDINRGIMELSTMSNEARWSTQPRILLELAIVRLCMGAGQIRELTEVEFTEPEPVPAPAKKTASAKAPEAPVKKVEEPAPVKAEEPVPVKAEEPVKEMKVEPVSVEPALAEMQNGFDCEDIWNKVFEDGENEKGSINIIRNSARLKSIEDKTFTVEANNTFFKDLAEKNRQFIEHLVEKHTGAHRRMNIKLASSETERSAEEIAAEASDILGIKVEVK